MNDLAENILLQRQAFDKAIIDSFTSHWTKSEGYQHRSKKLVVQQVIANDIGENWSPRLAMIINQALKDYGVKITCIHGLYFYLIANKQAS